jgi:hypothetical protein
MSAVSAVALWQTVGVLWLCKLPVFLTQERDNSCLEFWLNRYQALVAAGAAVAAALLAARPVWRQLATLRAQTAAAAYPALLEALKRVLEDREVLEACLFEPGSVLATFKSDLAFIREARTYPPASYAHPSVFENRIIDYAQAQSEPEARKMLARLLQLSNAARAAGVLRAGEPEVEAAWNAAAFSLAKVYSKLYRIMSTIERIRKDQVAPDHLLYANFAQQSRRALIN